MHITLWKLEKTKARLCCGKTVTTDKAIADMVEAAWKAEGYIVTRETEY